MGSQVYVALLDDGVEAYRPVTAEAIGPMLYKLTGDVPDGEKWEFQPGEIVRCEDRVFTGGNRGLVAIAPFGLR